LVGAEERWRGLVEERGSVAELWSSSRPEASLPRLLLLGEAMDEEERGEELGEAGCGYL
jgi:hypothetical protein